MEQVGQKLDLSMSTGLRRVNAAFTFTGLPADNIRLDPKLEPAGALGDGGWDAIRMVLWGFKWELPQRCVCLATGRSGLPMLPQPLARNFVRFLKLLVVAADTGALREVSGWLLYDDGRYHPAMPHLTEFPPACPEQ